jgi:hypothetical protein
MDVYKTWRLEVIPFMPYQVRLDVQTDLKKQRPVARWNDCISLFLPSLMVENVVDAGSSWQRKSDIAKCGITAKEL